MSGTRWRYNPEVCEGDFCPGDCDVCPKETEEKEMDEAFERCKKCVHSSCDNQYGGNGCKAWSCEFIPRKDAVAAYKKLMNGDLISRKAAVNAIVRKREEQAAKEEYGWEWEYSGFNFAIQALPLPYKEGEA